MLRELLDLSAAALTRLSVLLLHTREAAADATDVAVVRPFPGAPSGSSVFEATGRLRAAVLDAWLALAAPGATATLASTIGRVVVSGPAGMFEDVAGVLRDVGVANEAMVELEA